MRAKIPRGPAKLSIRAIHDEFRTSKSRDNQRKRSHIKMTAVGDIHLCLQTE